MRRLAWVAAALAAACGETPKTEPGPLDRVYLPTGLAVHRFGAGPDDARLVVASSNGDLRFDDATGGALLALDPATDPAAVRGAINIRSFAGDLAIADPAQCPGIAGPLALVATRGSNVLYAAALDAATGALSCDGCDVPLSGRFSEPFAVEVACGAGRSRAFIGHLSAPGGEGWISEYDLVTGAVRSMSVGRGPVRGFAYDAARDRLYLAGLATSAQTPLRWVELGGCTIGAGEGETPCTVGEATLPELTGVELRAIALGPVRSADRRRAYLTGRRYDVASAATAGGRVDDEGGVLLVVDLVDNARGGVDLQLVAEGAIGRGAQDVRVLPPDPANPGRADVVAALSVDDGMLWIYDGARPGSQPKLFSRDPATGEEIPGGRSRETGAPVLGHEPFGLAVDPEPVGTAARLYVGAYRDSVVTPVDVPYDAPEDARFTGPGGAARRITGGTP